MMIQRFTSPVMTAVAILVLSACATHARRSVGSCVPVCGAGTTCNSNNECVPISSGDAGSTHMVLGDDGSVAPPHDAGATRRVDAGTGTIGGHDAGITVMGTPDAGSTMTTTGNYCGACAADADCGGGNNFCLAFSFGNYCGLDCSAGACPAGSECQAIGDGSGGTVGMNCVPPTGSTCGGTTTTGNYCGACTADADCGGGNNFCLAFSFGDYCGVDCSAGGGCPSGSECQAIGDGTGATIGMNCVPSAGGTCSGSTGGVDAGHDAGSGPGHDAGHGVDAGHDAGSTSCTPDTYTSWAHSFFTAHCIGCHSGEFTASDARSRATSIASYISSGSMPRGETLSSSDKNRILTWLRCGAP